MAMDRKRPEDFLELVERAKRGRLKVYIGSAAGVGKTYQMLEEAHALKKRGVDVVLAFIETHDRLDTAALIEGLEVIPRQRVEYKGVAIEEMDLDAVLQRRPQVAIVDELAHTNAPFCRNKKRYQDVLELLDAGINLICAFNVQHLESLNDMVKQATGVIVRETVPDSILKRADQVVDIDLAVEDLIDRLRAGKIYAPEKVSWALENFFQPEKLAVLREIALREVAESVDRTVSAKAATDDAARQGRGQRTGDGLFTLPSAAPRCYAAQAGIPFSRTVKHRLVCGSCGDQTRSGSSHRCRSAALSYGGRAKSTGSGR